MLRYLSRKTWSLKPNLICHLNVAAPHFVLPPEKPAPSFYPRSQESEHTHRPCIHIHIPPQPEQTQIYLCTLLALLWKICEKHSVTESSFNPLSHLHKAVLIGKTDSIALHGQYICHSINWQGPFIASMIPILQADGEFEPRSPIADCNKDCQIKGCVGEQEAGWEEELLLCFVREKKKTDIIM